MPGIANVPIGLAGPAETMLATLYARAVDADAAKPILGDTFARDLVDRIDYDWRKTGVTVRNASIGAVRGAHLDKWARQRLARDERTVVLHVGCGLDGRVFRLDPGAAVEWYDIDGPDVIALVKRLYPARAHYHPVAASVADARWLRTIPTGCPVLLIAEGLTQYLTRADGLALLRRVVEQFPSGELHFDVCNWLGITLENFNPIVRRSRSTLHWAVNKPDSILDAVAGLRLLSAISIFDTGEFKHVPSGAYRALGRMMRTIPALRNAIQLHRYAF
ncbi:class I SAM-dependent methyltransferase [Mycolicibacterium llatzerense]|uniref:class I SAM-dependent methyltransferase n=1 Tax=Mycolicibacterium llatzerense TaxID=280871 RepID=UPI0021B54B47|nr:class I SAM-dependent methyltransferase [Mycolicibacterium llatzerense]MCT7361617.1 methyltransferase [Mycolicibacterium llatzerense]